MGSPHAFEDADLRELAELSAPDRAFLSVFLSGPSSVKRLEGWLARIRKVLTGPGAGRDEREHLDHNAKIVMQHLESHPLESGAMAIYCCWALDFFRAIPVSAPLSDLVRIGASPYVRPLAELADEYENVAVVVADNTRARIFLVSSAVETDEHKVVGKIKNHVRKGGWSQQRYERRRDGELLHYSREIASALDRLAASETFRRVILLGSKETIGHVEQNLSARVRDKRIGARPVDLSKGPSAVQDGLWQVFFEQERASEAELWERIRTEYLGGGLGLVGLADVLHSAASGRVEAVVVTRDHRPEGTRCRDCGHLETEQAQLCTACGSESVHPVDLVDELVHLCEQSRAVVDFVDPIETLTEAGHVAALLRY